MALAHWRAALAKWSPAARKRVVGALLALGVITGLLAGPQALPGYVNFADRRDFLGVPNFADVVSNLGFLLVGLYGLWCLRRPRPAAFAEAFETSIYRWLFLGVLLTAMGSAYFHWQPGNERLFWDRLPITIVLMTLLCATFAERIDVAFARRWFVPLLVIGPAAALHWRWTVSLGAEDLRVYGLAQYLTLLIVAVLHVFPSRYRAAPWILWGMVIYAIAKVSEGYDSEILWLTAGAISGHTAKHLIAAAGLLCIVMYVTRRQRAAHPNSAKNTR